MSWDHYWEHRKHLQYYKVVKQWLEELGPKNSIIDIGCGGCPVATWGEFKNRVALNKEPFHEIKNVNCVVDDWLNYSTEPVDVITCLQVLEHFPSEIIDLFVEKIFKNCKIAIISVPYMWEKGSCEDHVQDPINLIKFINLIKRDPVKLEITNDHRMVAMFIDHS